MPCSQWRWGQVGISITPSNFLGMSRTKISNRPEWEKLNFPRNCSFWLTGKWKLIFQSEDLTRETVDMLRGWECKGKDRTKAGLLGHTLYARRTKLDNTPARLRPRPLFLTIIRLALAQTKVVSGSASRISRITLC